MDRYVDRRLEPVVRALLDEVPAVAITGPRGVGKTTLALRMVDNVLRLDRPDDATLVAADPDAAVARVGSAGPDRGSTGRLLIDEWQEVPDVLGAVKRAVDADPRPGRFVLTGSVRGELTAEQWPGTGRVLPLRLYGLVPLETETSVRWPTAFIDRCFDPSAPVTDVVDTAWALTDYVDRALASGFPATAGIESERVLDRWVDGYVEQLLERDVTEVASRIDTARLRRYLEALAAHTATDVATQTLSEAAGVSWHTAEGYRSLLERLHVVHELPAWHSNRLKRLTKAPKRHLVEPALVRGLLRADADGVLRDASLRGRVVESWVVLQLLADAQWCETRARLFHLRTQDRRREIDLVIEGADGRLVAIEVKATAAPKPDDARHLRWFRDTVGDRLVRTVLLHTGRHAFQLGDDVEAMPIAGIWSG